MADHLSKGVDRDSKSVTQLQNELIKAKRKCLRIYSLYKESVETNETLYRRCIQAEAKLKMAISLFFFSMLLNGILIGICLHLTQRSSIPSPKFYIPERMIPNIEQIG